MCVCVFYGVIRNTKHRNGDLHCSSKFNYIHYVFLKSKGWKTDRRQNCIMMNFTVCILHRMRWAGHVARIERGEVFTGFWLGGQKVRDHWEDLGLDGRITLS